MQEQQSAPAEAVNLGVLAADFDVVREVVAESIFNSGVYCALLKAVNSGSQEDMLAYAKKQIGMVKEYLEDKAGENPLLHAKLNGISSQYRIPGSIPSAQVTDLDKVRMEALREKVAVRLTSFIPVYTKAFPGDDRIESIVGVMTYGGTTSENLNKMAAQAAEQAGCWSETNIPLSATVANNYRAAWFIASAVELCTRDKVDSAAIENLCNQAIAVTGVKS